ncbi:hypothetical protein FISHEDRAFT_61065 [Fistulina hepatica ATCC 64428]|uniref:Uncharacterized protein n=1 Tax=Fistulina hepatica ATCC 64428 TaxID=1128425 RepID=A0A0D7A4C6_9AGAR|nr:hypothetical protein FISHEDRAFT_61065 [Fistulina hepatica ATCC 64428]
MTESVASSLKSPRRSSFGRPQQSPLGPRRPLRASPSFSALTEERINRSPSPRKETSPTVASSPRYTPSPRSAEFLPQVEPVLHSIFEDTAAQEGEKSTVLDDDEPRIFLVPDRLAGDERPHDSASPESTSNGVDMDTTDADVNVNVELQPPPLLNLKLAGIPEASPVMSPRPHTPPNVPTPVSAPQTPVRAVVSLPHGRSLPSSPPPLGPLPSPPTSISAEQCPHDAPPPFTPVPANIPSSLPVSLPSSHTPLGIKSVPNIALLKPLPPPRFEPVQVQWKGLPYDAALWTLDGKELQSMVSRAIRASARESFIRLLSAEILDETLPAEIKRLSAERRLLQSKYRFSVHRRTMLLQSLVSFSAVSCERDSDSSTSFLSQLPQQIAELTAETDQLTEDLLRVSDQIAQIKKLVDAHWASALAIALRKLNTSYGRRTSDLVKARERIHQLEGELEDAWREAEHLAEELDERDERDAQLAIDDTQLYDAYLTSPMDDTYNTFQARELAEEMRQAVIERAAVVTIAPHLKPSSTSSAARTTTMVTASLVEAVPGAKSLSVVTSTPFPSKTTEYGPASTTHDDAASVLSLAPVGNNEMLQVGNGHNPTQTRRSGSTDQRTSTSTSATQASPRRRTSSRVSHVSAARRRSLRLSIGSLRLRNSSGSGNRPPPMPALPSPGYSELSSANSPISPPPSSSHHFSISSPLSPSSRPISSSSRQPTSSSRAMSRPLSFARPASSSDFASTSMNRAYMSPRPAPAPPRPVSSAGFAPPQRPPPPPRGPDDLDALPRFSPPPVFRALSPAPSASRRTQLRPRRHTSFDEQEESEDDVGCLIAIISLFRVETTSDNSVTMTVPSGTMTESAAPPTSVAASWPHTIVPRTVGVSIHGTQPSLTDASVGAPESVPPMSMSSGRDTPTSDGMGTGLSSVLSSGGGTPKTSPYTKLKSLTKRYSFARPKLTLPGHRNR